MTQNFKENLNINFVSRLELWFSGKMLKMLKITVKFSIHSQNSTPKSRGEYVEPWRCGDTATETSRHGAVEMWRRGATETWSRRDAETRSHEAIEP